MASGSDEIMICLEILIVRENISLVLIYSHKYATLG